MKIAVTGTTGTQGGAVARLLTERGHEVRRVTRNPKHPNDVHGDFDNPASLEQAFAGVDGLFLMTPLGGLPFEVRQPDLTTPEETIRWNPATRPSSATSGTR